MGATHDDIRTRWHKVWEITKSRANIKLNTGRTADEERREPKKGMYRLDVEMLDELLRIADPAPKFYLEKSLLDIMGRDDVLSSVQAMKRAGVLRLPFPMQVVEFDQDRGQGDMAREIVIISERRDETRFPGEDGFHPYRCNLMRTKKNGSQDSLVLTSTTIYIRYDDHADAGGGRTDFGVHWIAEPAGYIHAESVGRAKSAMDNTVQGDLETCERALSCLILLLNTRGVNKRVVDVPKVNRKRAASGKKAIPTHTILRIGTVYNSKGQGQEVTDEMVTKRTVRVHWRIGHYRGVRYGVGREKIDVRYFPPCLVNYQGEDPAEIKPYSAKVRV